MKSFKTDHFITENSASGNSILSPAELSKQIQIAKRKGFSLTPSRKTNMNLYWEAIKLEMNQLKPSHPVRYHYEQDLRTWGNRFDYAEIIIAYLKHEKVYDTEFMVLASPALDKLYDYCYDLRREGIDCSPVELIENGANYYEYLSKYSKKNADKDALKSTTNLVQTLDGLTNGLSNEAKANLASVIMQYLQSFDKPMDFSDLHNAIYRGQ